MEENSHRGRFMDSKICCFTGHRAIPEGDMRKIFELLPDVLEELYTKGVREFRTGGALGFDTLAALRVLAFRKTHPDVRLNLILPCRDQDQKWVAFDRETYRFVIEKADSVMYVSDLYTPGCMHKRNRSLVCGSDFCVCYVARSEGGSAYTFIYALECGLEIINLYDIIKGST